MNLQERINNLETLKENWKELGRIIGNDQEEETIERENTLTEQLSNLLPFKDQQEKEHWLDVCQSFKFWEDFEGLTNSIIWREENEIEYILEKCYNFALELARDADFKTLYDAFKPFSSGWVDEIKNFPKWWADFSENEQDKTDYLKEYKEIYEEDFDLEKISTRYHAFECCCMPWFYESNESGKSDLIECIFERLYQGLNQREQLDLYKGIINGILNKDLFKLLKGLKNAFVEFEEDIDKNNSTKGSLDRLEYAQSDLLDWVKDNIE